jgi:hypothetical protein
MGAPAVPSSTSSVVMDPPCLPRAAMAGGVRRDPSRRPSRWPRPLQPARYCWAGSLSDGSGAHLSVVLTLPGVDLLVSKGAVSDGDIRV